jgi:ATP-binding cassette, subfamily B, bacterial MsbA
MRTENFKRQSYLRLLKLVKPYKTMLIIGIVAGILTGGFFGASFFWLKGLVAPFEKTSAELQSQSMIVRPGNKSSKDADVSQSEQKKQGGYNDAGASQMDSVVGIAHSFGINLQNENGQMTLLALWLFIGSFIIVWFLKNLSTYINKYCMQWVGTRVVADMRNFIFRRLLNQSLVFYGKADVGQLISRCIQDTDQIQSGVSNSIADLTSCPFQIAGCFGFIAFVSITNNNFVLLGTMIAAGLLVLLPLVIIGKKVRKVFQVSNQRIAEVISRMHEVFSGIILVKAYYTEDKEYALFSKVNTTFFKSLIRAMKASLMMSPLTEFVGVAAIAVFFIYAFTANILLSDIVVLIVPALLAYEPLKKLAKVNNNLQRCMAAADRYFDLVDTDTSLKEISSPKPIVEFKKEIAFKNVSFAYNEQENTILNDISFSLKKGKMVAIVGETGSGKTTMANLLARFYDVSSGKISIDGTDVRDLKISDLRNLIGIVTQSTILFNESVNDNIAYGVDKEKVSQKEIIKAAKQANAHGFIVGGNHVDGYETIVGEKGFKLSGGEKQRIAIARAILRNPPILILDEATSALDTVTEKLVQDALTNLMENRTVFAIAHRLSTIKHADMIIVMDKGKIIERGTHEELMAKPDGHYHYLHDIQFD